MFGIPRSYSHFIFGVIQAGLTSLIAAGIASFPSLNPGSVFKSLAIVLARCMDRDVAGSGIGRSGDKSDLGRAHERRVSSAVMSAVGPSGHSCLHRTCPLSGVKRTF